MAREGKLGRGWKGMGVWRGEGIATGHQKVIVQLRNGPARGSLAWLHAWHIRRAIESRAMARLLVTLLTHHADKAPSNSTHFRAVLFTAANDVQAALSAVLMSAFENSPLH